MTWTIASDIADRIKNLRMLLGGGDGRPIFQEQLARRAGVRTSQVSQWERGSQRPSRNRLERWAEREGWPIEIFREGAPMPSEILSPPAPGGEPVLASLGVPGQAPTEPNQILARFYEVMADASRGGSPCPSELAVLIQQMHRLALKASSEPQDRVSSDEESPPPGPEKESKVPGW